VARGKVTGQGDGDGDLPVRCVTGEVRRQQMGGGILAAVDFGGDQWRRRGDPTAP
jgi:hypothetical protein